MVHLTRKKTTIFCLNKAKKFVTQTKKTVPFCSMLLHLFKLSTLKTYWNGLEDDGIGLQVVETESYMQQDMKYHASQAESWFV